MRIFVLLILIVSVVLEIILGRVFSTNLLILRIIRTLLGVSVGFALGSTGAALQRVYKNPLADGYILGISGGAIFGIALGELMNINIPGSLLALIVSIIVGIFVVMASFRLDEYLIPVFGIGLGMFFSSLAVLFFMLAGVESTRTFYALWGSLGRFFSVKDIPISLLIFFISVVLPLFLIFRDRDLDAVSLGEVESLCLGYDPKRITIYSTIVSSIVVAILTSYVGIVGFVGVMSPHIVGLFHRKEGKDFYLLSGMVGVILVLMADSLGRVILGIDPPIGIIMSIIGAPFFIYLVLKERKNSFTL